METRLAHIRGAFALAGSFINELAQDGVHHARFFTDSDTALTAPQPYHITLFTKTELRTLPRERVDSLQPDLRHIFPAGVGGNKDAGVFYIVIIWAAGQQLRKQFGLPPKHFHITLSSNDNHDMDKGIDSLFPDQFPVDPTPGFVDHLAFTLHGFGQYPRAREFSSQLIVRQPDVSKGYLRLADSALSGGLRKLAMLAYASAYKRTEDEKVQYYCVKKLIDCSKETEWGPVLQEHEVTELPEETSVILLEPWSVSLREALSDKGLAPTLQLYPRDSLFIPRGDLSTGDRFYRLPRFFRWLIPHYLAIMSTPRGEEDISALASPFLGIRHVLTLTEETPLPEGWFRGKPITNTYLPIPNYQPPTIEQMDLIISLFNDSSKQPLLVHCGGGKGRAGTVAACYMVAFGFKKPQYHISQPTMSAAEAINALRSVRPESVETPQQEAFVAKWCSTIWKRQSVYPDIPSEPAPCPMVIEGGLPSAADLFVLVGLPGSGKSWLSNSLLTRNPSGWLRISQDDSGSRSSCEVEIGKAPRGQRVLLDRCNAPASDRKEWLKLASSWCSAPVCVWFDYGLDLCLSRAQMRAGHPTLPPGSRVRNAVDQMHKLFVRPSLQEGFKAIIIIRSFAAAEELAQRLSPPLNIYKFPRTPHLINLGAATSDDITTSLPIAIEGRVVITEKVDGANMGFSLSPDGSEIVVQNRSHYVNSATHEQFKKLGTWIEQHREDLLKVLNRDVYFPQRYILYGEWLYATHSIPYTNLPDRFLTYDLYDRTTDSFIDRKGLMALLSATSIGIVPTIYEGETLPTESKLRSMVQTQSQFWDGRLEGIYVKIEKDGKVQFRGKIVRSDFITGNDHWTRGGLRVNGLLTDKIR
ncbi:hypothetical protein AX15_000699 [Amanita polypyramis BW_CC]|nr:hypothetical protein AX15_000699 [Amanita polypyramis BW_CC]